MHPVLYRAGCILYFFPAEKECCIVYNAPRQHSCRERSILMHSNSLWERKLNISTAPAYIERDDANHSRYEPTDYRVLKRLSESGYITRENTLVDYGCGKGRVSFFMNYVLGCRTVGVEYNEELYRDALENLNSYSGRTSGESVRFLLENAEYHDPSGSDRFYFFNPFSEKILRSVIHRITDSFYDNSREMYLFFYFALDNYRSMLMQEPSLEFTAEIDCNDIFQSTDSRESILVFKVTGGL